MKCAILGCGYVGGALADLWRNNGYILTCTTTKKSRIKPTYANQNWILAKGNDFETICELITEHEVLVVSVTPRSLDNYRETYLATAETIKKAAKKVKKARTLIFTGASSVYGDHKGKWVDENSPLLAKVPEIRHLISAEEQFLSLREWGWNILLFRLTEIYGPGRELKEKMEALQEKTLPGSGNNHANMVHLHDVVHAIDYCLSHGLEGIYNLADDDHLTQKELYEILCKRFSLPLPHWDPHLDPLIQMDKRVSNHKIKKTGFTFEYPHKV